VSLIKVAILKTKKETWRVAVSWCLCLCERDEKDGDEESVKECSGSYPITKIGVSDVESDNFSIIELVTRLDKTKTKLNSVACSPQANYTDRAAAACRRS
jgi:hypothetical protein